MSKFDLIFSSPISTFDITLTSSGYIYTPPNFDIAFDGTFQILLGYQFKFKGLIRDSIFKGINKFQEKGHQKYAI